MLTFAIITITIALILYTIGVWAERLGQRLRPWHLIFFFGGLAFDIVGTGAMNRLAGGDFDLNLHSASGLLALFLMAVHAVWAAVTVIRGNERALTTFHRYSIIVWIVWLIPYTTGLVLNSGLFG